MNLTNELPNDIRFLCEWIHDFDKLLSDRIGIRLFAEFLKKEYSYENLKFWTSCRKYKKISDKQKRIQYAQHIYNKYISTGASETVNVDNKARVLVESGLKNPDVNLFAVAEKQIYELMKFDCYKRFLHSFYSNNMTDNTFHEKIFEKVNKSKANTTVDQTMTTRYRKNAFKKLKKLEINEINRKIAIKKQQRVSLTPKNKLVNRDRLLKYEWEKIQKSRSSYVESKSLDKTKHSNKSGRIKIANNRTLTVILPNDTHEKLSVTESQTIRRSLEKLLEKKRLNYTSFDAFPLGSDKALDLNSDILNLNCDKIRVEQRIIFELELPNQIITTVISKPSKLSGIVLNSVLNEYGFDSQNCFIKFSKSSKLLDSNMPIFCADNKKLVVVSKECPNESPFNFGDKKSLINSTKILYEFLEEENYLKDNLENKCSNILNFSDISFSDDSRADTFFNDLMLSSQIIPNERNELTLLGKTYDKNDKPFKDSPKENKVINKRQLKSPKIKKSYSLKSDQLYDKSYAKNSTQKSSKTSSQTKLMDKSRSQVDGKCESNISMRTLSQFHKTLSQELELNTEHKPVVPKVFNFEFKE